MNTHPDDERIVEGLQKLYPEVGFEFCQGHGFDIDKYIRTTLATLRADHEKQLGEVRWEERRKSREYTERRLAMWLVHKPRCYLYNEEGAPEQCDCGLYQALTPPSTEELVDKG